MANVKELETFLQMIIIILCVACHEGVMLFLQSAFILKGYALKKKKDQMTYLPRAKNTL